MEYGAYQSIIRDDITHTLSEKHAQPVLFVGSGLSRRYVGLPDWHGLLAEISKQCPLITKEYPYYQQTVGNPIEIASIFSDFFHTWAWSDGKKDFPPDLFHGGFPKDTFLKYAICKYIEEKMSKFHLGRVSAEIKREVNTLRQIKPHAIITTNYDTLVERIFADYEVVIGQSVIRSGEILIGEVFKIHGSSTEIQSLVINRDDYTGFIKKKKYLTAKLLTLFTEHPLLLIGYSVDDPNVKSILSDIDEILSPVGALIPNIYFLQWDENAEATGNHPVERLIPVEDSKSVRVKGITASDFSWVFEAFSSDTPLVQVSPKILRSIMARTYQMVRSDIPKRKIEIDLKSIEDSIKTKDGVPKLFGLASHTGGTSAAFDFPHTTGMVADYFKLRTHDILVLIRKINLEKGVNIKASDNKYHWLVKTGRAQSSQSHHYSNAAVELFSKVLKQDPYELEL